MAPTLVRAPFHRDGKVDGWRMLTYKDTVTASGS
jgi:hypothetical protein